MRTLAIFWASCLAAVGCVALAAGRGLSAADAEVVVICSSICAGAAMLGMIPPALVSRRAPEYLFAAGMGSVVIRLFLTLGVGGFYWMRYSPPQLLFTIAIMLGYLGMLAVETCVIIGIVRRTWRGPVSA